MRIYLSGPMTGIPQFNYPAFIEATAKLRELGYDVFSPHEGDSPELQAESLKSTDGKHGDDGKLAGETWGQMLARDVIVISDTGVEAIMLLPGWTRSRGARLEAFVGLLHQRTRFFEVDVGDGAQELALFPIARRAVVELISTHTN